MKLTTVIAKLSLTGKLAVGGSVAFAALGGVGAAGALPGPLQEGYRAAISVVSPQDDGPALVTGVDSTVAPEPSAPVDEPTTSAPDPTSEPPTETTEPPTETTEPAPDTTAPVDGGGGGEPEPTTVPLGDGQHDNGEHGSPESITLTCATNGAAVHCEWSGDPLPDGARYVLLKVGDQHKGRALFPAPGAMSFDDDKVQPGRTIHYMVIAMNHGERRPIAHSNRVKVKVPGLHAGDGNHGDGNGAEGSHGGAPKGGHGDGEPGDGEPGDTPPSAGAESGN